MVMISIFLLIGMLSIIVFNIIALDKKNHQEVLQLNKSSKLLIANKYHKTKKIIGIFKKSNSDPLIWAIVSNGNEMNVNISYLNKHIVAINSLNRAYDLLSKKVSGNESAVYLAGDVILKQLQVIRNHALLNSDILSSYQDKYLKEAIFLLQNISTSTVSSSERQTILNRSYQSLIDQAHDITNHMLFVLSQQKKAANYLLYSLMILLILIFIMQLKAIDSILRRSNKIKNKVLFISQYFRENNPSNNNFVGTPIETLYNNVKILIGELSNKKKIINKLHQKMQNSNLLTTLLRYEINSQTSLVSGGLSVNEKEDVQEGPFDQEISGALTSLGNLSGNFNHLFSLKEHKISLDKEFNVREQLNKIFVLINATCRGLNKDFDFLIEDAVPKMICGDANQFYWCLYSIFVRCIESMEQNYCFLHIKTIHGTSIDNKTLQVNLLCTSTKQLSLSSFLESMYQLDAGNDLLDVKNKELYQDIIQNFSEGSISFKENDLDDLKITINMIITPKHDKDKKLELSVKVLIYANDGLQTSIILEKLEQVGANIVHCKSDDELLKQVSKNEPFDFVFISDELLQNKVLIQIVAGKIKAKIMRLSNINITTGITDSVIEARLNLPLYQSKLIEVLSNPEVAEEEEEVESVNVLIVDDDSSQQFILSHFLKRVGIEPILANDCDSALALIKENSFDLVFMDCIMPGKDGFVTTGLIRKYEESLKLSGELKKSTTIIGNTSLTASSDIDKCIQSGMDAVLHKPYKKEKLLELLARHK